MPSSALRQRLLGCVQEGRVASAYILEGMEGAGKLELARFFARALCCPQSGPQGPCGSCRVCRQIEAGQYPDVTELSPEAPDKPIPVDAVRRLIGEAELTGTEAPYRVFVICQSQAMNPAAQNALLKSIEEPHPGVVFLLLTDDRKALLPTVISRSVCLHLPPLTDPQMHALLEKEFPGTPPEKLAQAVSLAGGSPGRARQILQEGDWLKKSRQAVEYLQEVSNSAGLARLEVLFAPAKHNRQSLVAFLSLLKLGLRDVILYQKLKERTSCRLFSSQAELAAVAGGISPKKAVRLLDHTEQLLLQTALNVNVFAAVSSLNLYACSKN